MSEIVGVSRSKLESTASEITTYNSTMSSRLNGVVDAVESIQTNYQSAESKELKTIASNMQVKFAAMKKEVETFASWLTTAAANYKVMEGAAESSLNKISGMFK